MGMPIVLEIVDAEAAKEDLERVFSYFDSVDRRFSTYKEDSEISRINRGELPESQWSLDTREVFALAEKTKQETGGYFDIRRPDGLIDPSGIVKGWAIWNAARLLVDSGIGNFYIDAGGDIASQGLNSQGQLWSVGIRNPFNREHIVKIVYPKGSGTATSGTYIRGQHIYNPKRPGALITDIVSATVIAPDVLEADRFATAAFAMGKEGIDFIERMPGLEGYLIDSNGSAIMTSGFVAYTSI